MTKLNSQTLINLNLRLIGVMCLKERQSMFEIAIFVSGSVASF